MLIHPEIAWPQQEIIQGMYTYIGAVHVPDVTLESCLCSIDIYIQRSAMERISPGAT